jgi:hypothetical protein
MTRLLLPAGAMLALLLAAPEGQASGCIAARPDTALAADEANAVYDCLQDILQEGYRQGDKRWIPAEYVEDYRSWTPASRYPAFSAAHGGRHLVTYVNQVGAQDYLRFSESEVEMPTGSLIAAESFSVDERGRAQPGPLFLMEKVEPGRSPQTDDWFYMAVAPNGSPMVMDVISSCGTCHQGQLGQRGGLGYPPAEARLTR